MAATKGGQAMAHLSRAERRRLLGAAIGRVGIISVVFVTLYYLMPLDQLDDGHALAYFLLGSVAFTAVLTLQLRRIVVADFPQIRAAEAVATAIPLLVIVFATVYVTMSQTNPANFSETMNHTGGIYFTVTVLSTVGFGDIVPQTDIARLAVAVQMLLDLVLLGSIVRVLFGAAEVGISERANPDTEAE